MSLLLCRGVYLDEETNEFCIDRIVQTVRVTEVPSRMRGFDAFAEFTGLAGAYPARMQLRHELSESPVWHSDFTLKMADPTALYSFGAATGELGFDTTGTYELEVFINSARVASRFIRVVIADGPDDVGWGK